MPQPHDLLLGRVEVRASRTAVRFAGEPVERPTLEVIARRVPARRPRIVFFLFGALSFIALACMILTR
ncbi:MAG: hypothetical protein ACXWUG_29845 [Polyangiales bacterium]